LLATLASHDVNLTRSAQLKRSLVLNPLVIPTEAIPADELPVFELDLFKGKTLAEKLEAYASEHYGQRPPVYDRNYFLHGQRGKNAIKLSKIVEARKAFEAAQRNKFSLNETTVAAWRYRDAISYGNKLSRIDERRVGKILEVVREDPAGHQLHRAFTEWHPRIK